MSIFLANRPKISMAVTAKLSLWIITSALVAPNARAELSDKIEDINLTAIAFECGVYGGGFNGEFFNSKNEPTNSLKSFVATQVKRDFNAKKDKSKLENAGYKSPVCEMFVLNALGSQDTDLAKERCESIRDPLFIEKNANKITGSNGKEAAKPNFSMSSFAFSGSSSQGNGADVAGEGPCDPETLPTLAGDNAPAIKFGCMSQSFREREKKDKKALQTVLLTCAQLGVNMNEVKPETYTSLANSGLDAMGGGYCGYRGGGPIIIRREKNNLETVLNASLGALKVLAPMYVMHKAFNKHEQTAQMAINNNYALGFPSAVYAGSGGGGWGGGGCGGGGGWGGGGCGGGNGGVIVGGGGGFCGGGMAMPGMCGGGGGHMGPGWGGGGGGGYLPPGGGGCACITAPCICGGGGGGGGGQVIGGGPCGLPPMAPWYGGCGGGGGSMNGGPGWGGGGNGFPGPGGTLGGGNGWGGGAGGGGVPGWGGGTNMPGWGNQGNGFPGPGGTLGGGNGWGSGGNNPYGYNGQFGQAPHWGAQNGQNANYAAQQAAEWERQAASMMRAAEDARRKAQLYSSVEEERSRAMNEWNMKSYKAWMAYEMSRYQASSGYYDTAQSGRGGVTGIYNPPYRSGGTQLNGAVVGNGGGSAGYLNFNYNSRTPSNNR